MIEIDRSCQGKFLDTNLPFENELAINDIEKCLFELKPKYI